MRGHYRPFTTIPTTKEDVNKPSIQSHLKVKDNYNKTLKHTDENNDKTAFKAKQNITQAKTANQQTKHKTAKHQRNKVRQIPTFRQFSIF